MQLTTDSCCINFMRSFLVESSQCLVFGVRGDRATPCFPPMQAQITWKFSDLICCAVCAT
jgi:hypothetical protein